jgi:glutaminyl-tRNA synthetase
LEVLTRARLEPALADVKPEVPVQFERNGYFCLDPDSTSDKPVFIRTIGLRDTFARDAAKDQAKKKTAG